MIRKKCVNNILNKSIVFAFVLFAVALSTQSASAAMDRSETQTMGYHHYWNTVADTPKTNPYNGKDLLVSGNVNIIHEISADKNMNGLCSGETVKFDYDPVITYNGIGGTWDTPYGDWCDNTESGCGIDMKNGNYQEFKSTNDPLKGKVHWTAIKPDVQIVSSDDSIVNCSDTTCTVKGSGKVTLKAKIDNTEARIWSVFNFYRASLSAMTGASKSILGIDRDSWDTIGAIVSPTDDGRFYGLDFDYMFPSMWNWSKTTPMTYYKDKKTYSFSKIEDSKNLSWEVTVGCNSISQCGTKNGGNGKTLSEVPGTKCSDSSNPVATNTNTGWSWMCGTDSCSANRTCADTDGNGKCDATCDASKNEINDPNDLESCCSDADNNGKCDIACTTPEIIDPVHPTQCCTDKNNNGVCDAKCTKEHQINDPNHLDRCCYDKDDDKKCDSGKATCDKSKHEIVNPIYPLQCCLDADDDGNCDLVCPTGQTVDPSGSVCCADADGDKNCDSAPGGGSVTCPAGQSANPNNPTECCADADGDGNCDCLTCEAGCLAPSIPNQVNLRRTGGAQDAKITIPAGLWCDINNNGAYEDGTEGSASHAVVVSVPVTSHPTPVNYSCQCAPSKTPAGSSCSANKPERITAGGEKICCSDSQWDGVKKVCGKGKNVFSQDIQCVCLSKKCSASGSCIATPVFAKSYTDSACKSECSSNADCSGGSVIPVP